VGKNKTLERDIASDATGRVVPLELSLGTGKQNTITVTVTAPDPSPKGGLVDAARVKSHSNTNNN
jgi:hypothetical protein